MQRWTVDTHCLFAIKFWILSCCCSGTVSDVKVCETDTRESMKVVCQFFYFGVIILTYISVLTEAVARRCSVKKVFLEISQNLQENKITP